MNKALIGMIIVLILAVGFWLTKTPSTTQTQTKTATILAGDTDSLYDFDQDIYNQAKSTDKLVVLYFYANWCPICKEETKNALYPFFNESTTGKIIGIRANFNDNETDSAEKALASQFGVAYQHTKVFVKNGERVLKSPETWDKARYQTEIDKLVMY